MRNLFKFIVLGSIAVAFAGCKSQPAQPASMRRHGAQPCRWCASIRRWTRLLRRERQIEKVATGFIFTEGPMWREGRLWFSDVVGNRMYTVTPDGKVTLMIEHSGGVDNPPAGSISGLKRDGDGQGRLCADGAAWAAADCAPPG